MQRNGVIARQSEAAEIEREKIVDGWVGLEKNRIKYAVVNV